MGPDWLKDRFNLDWNDIRNIVINACERSGWQHADDVCGEVCSVSTVSIATTRPVSRTASTSWALPAAMQGFAYCTPSGKCGDWSFMTPGNCQNPWRGRARMTSPLHDREQLLALLADCQQTLSLLATASLSFATFSVSTARG